VTAAPKSSRAAGATLARVASAREDAGVASALPATVAGCNAGDTTASKQSVASGGGDESQVGRIQTMPAVCVGESRVT